MAGVFRREKDIDNAMCHEKPDASTPFAPHLDLTSLLETLSDALIFLDDAGTIQYANERAATMIGASQSALPGNSLWQCAPQLISNALYQAVGKARRTYRPLQVEYRSPVTRTWLHVYLSPTSQGLAVFFSEETEPARLQDAFRQGEQRYQDLLESISDGVVILTPGGLVLEINQRPLADARVRREEVVGKPFTEFPSWSYDPAVQQQLRVAIEQASLGDTVRFEARIRPQPGKYRDLTLTITPRLDANQQVEYLICAGRDITTYKQAEAEIYALVESIPNLIWVARPDGYVEYCSQRWYHYTGLTREQTQGDGWSAGLHPEDQQRALAMWHAAVQTGTPYERASRIRNGTTGEYRWFLARGIPLTDSRGSILRWLGTSTDIDEQKRTEEALRQSQERVHALIDSNIIGIIAADGEEIVEANDAFLRMTGYSREDVYNRSVSWVRMTPPEYLSATRQAHQELALHRYMTPYEKEYVCKDGSRLPVLVGGVAFQDNPLQNIDFVLDNSARKELERRKDDFISMASHELKTPLTSLKLQTQLLGKHLAKQGISSAAPALSRMEVQVRQLERLVGELLDVSKIQAGRLEYVQETVDLDELLQEVIETMQQMSETHTIVQRGAVPGSLIGDKDRLEQVFINLLSNAIKYAPDAPLIEVEVSRAAESVTISVRDQGMGIPCEQREKIFERFYRAFDPSQRAVPGLGMGLYIVAEIVKQHGGTITVESKVGKGSTFHVALPLTRQ